MQFVENLDTSPLELRFSPQPNPEDKVVTRQLGSKFSKQVLHYCDIVQVGKQPAMKRRKWQERRRKLVLALQFFLLLHNSNYNPVKELDGECIKKNPLRTCARCRRNTGFGRTDTTLFMERTKVSF
jgi:hypothetical protein